MVFLKIQYIFRCFLLLMAHPSCKINTFRVDLFQPIPCCGIRPNNQTSVWNKSTQIHLMVDYWACLWRTVGKRSTGYCDARLASSRLALNTVCLSCAPAGPFAWWNPANWDKWEDQASTPSYLSSCSNRLSSSTTSTAD